ncbi:phage holin family protein [Roseomonas chloroacetimidivorans]|jgi:apolipoprotein N-acyltransferase|uniref:phage holin family protein n=1 Tax=Roseomonas chloroacetimidivorans TaxID=1766656 RepID=UPI003C74BF17
MSQHTDRSIPDLLGDLVDQTSTLVRKEVQLARAEIGEKVSVVGAASASLAIGGVLLLGALVILLQAAVAFLVEFVHLSATVSALIVAVVVAVIGYLVLRGGLNRLKASNLTPDRTVTQLSRDAEVAKEQVR